MSYIGPVSSYQQIYVAACGVDFCTRREGVERERHCPQCWAVMCGLSDDVHGDQPAEGA